MKKAALILFVSLAVISPASAGQYLGQLSRNPYTQKSTSEVGVNNYRITGFNVGRFMIQMPQKPQKPLF